MMNVQNDHDLKQKHCLACEGDTQPMDDNQAREMLGNVPDWEIVAGAITRTFSFKDFYQTISFVNAVAWIANREDHHPDLRVSYKNCQVTFSTHAIGGLSLNDFICAAKVDGLLAE